MDRRGAIIFFSEHPVAANLLLVLMILFGFWGMTKLNRQVLPNLQVNAVAVTVQWPGASPEDVEANVIEAIEPEVRFIDRVEKVRAVAQEALASITIEFEADADMSKALADVQSAIARITTFPADIERPVIAEVVETDEVCQIDVSGPFPEQSLKLFAKRIRDDLLDMGLSNIDMVGLRDSEIWVEFDDDVLRELDLTLADIAARVSDTSLDLPAGSIESGGVSRQIRSEALARSAPRVGEIEVLSRTSGEKLKLRDIARIHATFAENSVSHVHGDGPSVSLIVRRARNVDSIEAQARVTAYLEQLRAELPPTLQVEMFDVFADAATQRVRMLVTNGIQGMVLVLGILLLFLNGRIAFWVAAGIPTSIMATLGMMAVLGLSLNMISMFAMIMALGMLADDAIVVGEHAEVLYRRGLPPDEAPVAAARTMLGPVLAACTTTMAAFFPILNIGSMVGQVIRELPIVMMIALAASFIECFWILPMHLKGAFLRMDRARRQQRPRNAVLRATDRFQQRFDRFRDGVVQPGVDFAFRNRYSTLLGWIGAFAIAVTMMATGRVGFEFFATPETDMIFANFALAPGATRERTGQMIEEIDRAVRAVEKDLTDGKGGIVRYHVGTIGQTEGRSGEGVLTGDHVGAYSLELISGDTRDVRNYAFIEALENEIRPIAGVERLTVFERSAGGPPGRDLDVRLSGAPLRTLKAAAADLRERIKNIPGLLAIDDNLPYGKQEIVMEMTPAGRAMGFTTQMVARQVRNAFEGAVARRFSQDQEEIIVRIKLQESVNARDTIRDLYLRSPDGSEVPLTEVVRLTNKVGFSQIRREDGLRQVSVSADVNPDITTTNAVMRQIEAAILPEIRQQHGVIAEFKGKAEEQAEALGDMRIAVMLALAGIYIILAWTFGNYGSPFVVMAVIPFGFVGAVLGHWLLGFNLNMLGLQALLGLSGVIINDCIVLVQMTRLRVAEGVPLQEAVAHTAAERLRPVLLTTLTTIGGLISLLFERSLQAQLVQPLAVTMIFGLAITPLLVLFFVPALMGIGQDMRKGRKAAGGTAAEAGPMRATHADISTMDSARRVD
jgi:multidrug efflux pump subunit AcrB